MPNDNLQFGDVTQVVWQGVTYNAGNPGPSGWTQAGVEADFGLRFGVDTYPAWSAAVSADVQDAIDDGVVIIGAAGNDNMLMAEVNDANWNNLVTINGVGTIYLNRGGWPNTPDSGSIYVGALSDHSAFRRSTYTNFGPAIDVFAPGDDILSSYGNTGFPDGKYAVLEIIIILFKELVWHLHRFVE
jgi:subtilisin family serine protease